MIYKELTDKYREMVHYNQYSELLLEIAKDFDLVYYQKAFQSILTIHDLEGQMRTDVYNVRQRFRDEMLEILEQRLSEEDYNIIREFI